MGFEEYRGSQADEVPIAELVARQFGTTHDTRWVSRSEFHRDFAAMLSAMDQPSIDGANTYFVSKAAKQAGLKAALSGLGGDELFGGYSSFQQIPQLVRTVGKFPPEPPKPCVRFRRRCSNISPRPNTPDFSNTAAATRVLICCDEGSFMPWELPNLLDPDLVREGWRALQPLLALEATVKDIASDRLRVSALEMTWYMRNQLLRDSDWAGMAHSLEIRVPLVDLTLTSFGDTAHAAFARKGRDGANAGVTAAGSDSERQQNRVQHSGGRLDCAEPIRKIADAACADGRCGWRGSSTSFRSVGPNRPR